MEKLKVTTIFLLLLSCLFSCNKNESTVDGQNTIIILYTNDEHGWMEPTDETGGAAGISGLWQARESYDGSDAFLILSGGDMWTGPAISTWFEGESMVAVMNQMGYDAAAVGNHEFDFTTDKLILRLQQMNFPLMAANLYEKGTENVPSFVYPYIIKESAGVKVGIIGLASMNTPTTAFPAYVAGYDFNDYIAAIEKYAPIVNEQGADFIIIVGHITLPEMQSLVPVAKKYNIPVVGGGHSHQSVVQQSDGVILMQTGGGFKEYIKIGLTYDAVTKKATVSAHEKVANNTTNSNSEVETIVNYWQSKTEEALAEEIGYCSATILQSSVAMGNMVADSWLKTFTDADVAITNSGGIRQDIEAGTVTLETIVGLLPFNNSIVKLKLTGSELIDCIDYFLIGGMTTVGGNSLADGTPIEVDQTYTVLTTDYLYSLSETNFATYDTEPENTSVNYRQPLIDCIKSLNTNASNPLNDYLDNMPRRN